MKFTELILDFHCYRDGCKCSPCLRTPRPPFSAHVTVTQLLGCHQTSEKGGCHGGTWTLESSLFSVILLRGGGVNEALNNEAFNGCLVTHNKT
jgi:hypothetical protein